MIALGSALAALAVATAALSRWGKTTAGARLGRRPALVTAAAMVVPPLLAAAWAAATFLAAHATVLEVKIIGTPAVSADGRLLYAAFVVHSSKKRQPDYGHDPGRLGIVDTATNRPAGPPVPVGSGPSGAAASHDGARVYVSNTGSGSVSVISTLEHAAVGTPIAIGHAPLYLAVSTDDRRLLVTDTDQGVSVIDTRTGTVTRRIALPADSREVTLSPDGSRAYACRSDQCDLVAIDTGTGRTVAGPVRLGYNPDAMAVSLTAAACTPRSPCQPLPGTCCWPLTPARSRPSEGMRRSATARISVWQSARTAGACMSATFSMRVGD